MSKAIILLLAIFTIVSGLTFYWFGWRPSEIRRWCYQTQYEQTPAWTPPTDETSKKFEQGYQDCLHAKGLKN